MDVGDKAERPVNEREPVTPRDRPQTDDLNNPFIEPFTLSKQMDVLRASLMSSASTSYLVPPFPVTARGPLIAPQREEPEPFSEPDWESLLNPNFTHLGKRDLIQKVRELQVGLKLARDGLRAREAIIESAHATNVILELTCQRQRTALHQKESIKSEKKDKCTLFGDGKAHVITDDDFIMALEEIDEREKEKEEGKEKRKEARTKAKESKVIEKKAWEEALDEWKLKREVWGDMCVQLREDGCRRKDLPKAPKRPKKADVLVALGERDLDLDESNGSSEGEDVDAEVEEEEEEGTDDEGHDNDNEAST